MRSCPTQFGRYSLVAVQMARPADSDRADIAGQNRSTAAELGCGRWRATICAIFRPSVNFLRTTGDRMVLLFSGLTWQYLATARRGLRERIEKSSPRVRVVKLSNLVRSNLNRNLLLVLLLGLRLRPPSFSVFSSTPSRLP
jgi:hypothetical protein